MLTRIILGQSTRILRRRRNDPEGQTLRERSKRTETLHHIRSADLQANRYSKSKH
jgi:hypothetical protein